MGIEQGSFQPEEPKQEQQPVLIDVADIPWSAENPKPQEALDPAVEEAARRIVSWSADEGKTRGNTPVEVDTPPNAGSKLGFDGITRR